MYSTGRSTHVGVWSSGMILALGARGREFDSRNAPFRDTVLHTSVILLMSATRLTRMVTSRESLIGTVSRYRDIVVNIIL